MATPMIIIVTNPTRKRCPWAVGNHFKTLGCPNRCMAIMCIPNKVLKAAKIRLVLM